MGEENGKNKLYKMLEAGDAVASVAAEACWRAK